MSDILDLDALIPVKAKIKFDGKEIDVKPPTTGQMVRLGGLGQKLQDIENLPPEKIDEAIDKLNELIAEIIPELKGYDLSMQQTLKLTELLGDMVTPPDSKELQDRGITFGGDTPDPKDQPNT